MGVTVVGCGARWTETVLCRTLDNQQWARRGGRRWDGYGCHSGCGGGIFVRKCNENEVMIMGHGRKSMVHGGDVVRSAVSISHNALG
jgi:hypothetical protein